MKKILLAVFITMFALVGCSNDEELEQSTSREELKVVTSILGTTDNNLKMAFNPDGSGNFEVGDRFTLSYIQPTILHRGIMYYEIGNARTWYWDELIGSLAVGDNSLKFGGWYPLSIPNIYPMAYKVAKAETEADKDLLIASPVIVNRGHPINLQFAHVMHKLIINLTSNYYDVTRLNTATISLKNLKSDAMVDFFNGTVNESAASGADSYTPKVGASVSFIVAPQNLTANTEIISIDIEGQTFIYKVPAGLTTLQSSHILTLNLDLKYIGTRSLTPANIEAKFIETKSWNREPQAFEITNNE